MENFSKWQDEEIKALFKFVEIKKSENIPLIRIFNEYAKKVNRKQNSVRNYYYKQLCVFQSNKNLAKEFNIDLQNHKVYKAEHFSKEQEMELLNKLNNLVNEGYSVRKACLMLSGGNAQIMLRLQNKFRSNIKKCEKPKSESMGQIIKMPIKKHTLCDEDIKALFLGLVKIIKKQEYDNAKMEMEKQLFSANEKLKVAMLKLCEKQNRIEKLSQEITTLQNKVQNSIDAKIQKTISKTAGNKLKEFFTKQNDRDFKAI